MPNFFQDNADLQFYVERGIDWSSLVELTERIGKGEGGYANTAEAVDAYKEVLDLIGQFVAEEVAPHAAQIDREGVRYESGEAVFPPRLESIFRSIKEMELHGMCLPRELGGQNCPLLTFLMSTEILARGEVSVMAHHSFHGGMALAMLIFSLLEGSTELDPERAVITKTRFAKEIDEIRRGDAWGSMDITEPNAGSDMAALRTFAEQDEAGNWFVTGQKIFITSGHGKYHFVIARTEKAKGGDDPFAGLAGLSMFLVPAYEEDADGKRRRIAALDRLEEKLGHHGSATAALTFDRAPAQLIGKRGDGFKHMLTLMNNARLGVGFESLGVCEAAYRLARDYARERASMGKTIDRHEIIADYLDEMETDILGIRALAIHGAINEEIHQKSDLILRMGLVKGEAERAEREAKRSSAKRRSRRVTPLVKFLAAEKAVEIARRGVQIHGGSGYTRDYGAEKLLRDAMVFPIYEGTSQIQALMAMKDTLQAALRQPQRFAARVAQARWRSASARDPLERQVAKIQAISLAAQQHLLLRTAQDKYRGLKGQPVTEWPERFLKNWDPKRDFAYAMLHAERLTRILADEAICEVLLDQANVHPERREVLERYLERAEPRVRYLHDRITTTGQRLLDKLSEDASKLERESA